MDNLIEMADANILDRIHGWEEWKERENELKRVGEEIAGMILNKLGYEIGDILYIQEYGGRKLHYYISHVRLNQYYKLYYDGKDAEDSFKFKAIIEMELIPIKSDQNGGWIKSKAKPVWKQFISTKIVEKKGKVNFAKK